MNPATVRRFHLVNVFTRDGGRLTGNPLCVFEDGSGLTTAEMQALALQFNLSETTFILPTAVSGATARVRIFTPGEELPFAGHPTLGTAHVLRRLRGGDSVMLDLAAGLVPVAARGDCWTLTAPQVTHRAVTEPPNDLAAAVGLEAGDLLSTASAGPLWVSTGTEQLLVPLWSADAVMRAAPDPGRISSLRSSQGNSMVGIFHDDGRLVTLRFFFRHGLGVAEDPATGSACANLGGWFIATGAVPVERTVYQGDLIHRPSTLRLSVGADRQIRVSGDVIYLGHGELQL